MEKILEMTEEKMSKTLDSVAQQLARLRSGKATPTLLESVKVDYYGSMMPISQIASISTPEPRLLVVHPWDKTAVPAVEKAIMASDLGLNPNSDGTVVRIPIPALTEERRKELVKIARKIGEEGKVGIRNIRREIIEEIKAKQKKSEFTEDDSFHLQEKVQEVTDKFSRKVDELLNTKEKEIMTV